MSALTLSIVVYSSVILFMVGVHWLTLIEEQKRLLKLNEELEQYANHLKN